jgi:predicted RNA binding protein YcfA (HicA-like mRNA interferase family)
VTRGLPEVSGARLKRALERAGFVEAPGTLSSILQHAGLSGDDLRELL